ncbi:MAG TPA: enoyl-CoA hydratase/isomerase family protein [Stellaceae bacterium]|nr:enoyl-CoA hydratase/isomerase family protein [Stellaceae bacterium]
MHDRYSSTDEILLERRGGVAIVTLNRPKALNTLTLAMYRRLDPDLLAWGADPAVAAVIIRGAGGRAFCAGGDVRAIWEAGQGKTSGLTADFFREEYCLIQRVYRFPKPYIALCDGITMGGGVGMSVHGSHRIATERFLFAMPETAIGLFPDVGATTFLNRCPGRIGRYLALTGARLKAADALYCGLATHFVPSERLPALTEALAGLAWRGGDARAEADRVIVGFAADAGPAPLAEQRAAIERCFAPDSIEGIIAALEEEGGPWAAAALDAIAKASPTSLKITLRQLTLGAGFDVEAALQLEYRMTQHVMQRHDFFEGVRALLVDKDQAPRWRPPRLAEVTEEEVAFYFQPLGARELRFEGGTEGGP